MLSRESRVALADMRGDLMEVKEPEPNQWLDVDLGPVREQVGEDEAFLCSIREALESRCVNL